MNEGSFTANGEFDELVDIGSDDDGFDNDSGVFAPFQKAPATSVDGNGIEAKGGHGCEGEAGDIAGDIGGFCIGPAQGIFDGEVSCGRLAPVAGGGRDFAFEEFGGEPDGGADAADGQVDGKIDLHTGPSGFGGVGGCGEKRSGERDR